VILDMFAHFLARHDFMAIAGVFTGLCVPVVYLIAAIQAWGRD
jgi:hypothetical protein